MTVSERTLSYRGSDVAAAYETVGYRSAHEPKLLRQRFSEIGNDIYDLLRLSYSEDDGATWSDDHPYQVSHLTPAGTVRTGYGTLVTDPGSGLVVALNGTSVMPTDHMLEALTSTFATYRVSDDDGLTWLFEDRIIQHGEEYDPSHPLQAVWTGQERRPLRQRAVLRSRGAPDLSPCRSPACNPTARCSARRARSPFTRSWS